MTDTFSKPLEPMALIATKDGCGCIVASVLKDAVDKKVLGKIFQELIAAGYNPEYVTHSYVLENWGVCDHGQKRLTPQPAAPKAEQNGSDTGIEYGVNLDGTTDLTPAQRSMRLMQAVQAGKVLTTDAPLQPENGAFLYFCAHAESKGEGEGYIYTIEEMTQLSPTDEPEVTDTQTFDNQHIRFTTALGDIASLFQWDIEEPEESSTTDDSIKEGILQSLREGYSLIWQSPSDPDDSSRFTPFYRAYSEEGADGGYIYALDTHLSTKRNGVETLASVPFDGDTHGLLVAMSELAPLNEWAYSDAPEGEATALVATDTQA